MRKIKINPELTKVIKSGKFAKSKITVKKVKGRVEIYQGKKHLGSQG